MFVLYRLRACHKTFKNEMNLPRNTFFTTYLKSGGRETKENDIRGWWWKKG